MLLKLDDIHHFHNTQEPSMASYHETQHKKTHHPYSPRMFSFCLTVFFNLPSMECRRCTIIPILRFGNKKF